MDVTKIGTDKKKHLTGAEPFHQKGGSLSTTVGDFWRWACSDLLSSPLRGVLAEFLVAKALGCAPPARQLADRPTLITPRGQRVEILSASFLKEGADAPSESAAFSIATSPDGQHVPRDPDSPPPEVHIFCLLKHRDMATVDPLDVTQWLFYVLKTGTYEAQSPAERTPLEDILALNPAEANFWTLPTAVSQILGE